jgi:hypothetical protein
LLTAIRKHRDITKTIGKSGWFELVARAAEAGDEFHARISTLPPEVDKLKAAGTMPIRDIVAHISDINFATGTILEGLTQSKPIKFKVEKFYVGAGGKRWDALLYDHLESLDWLQDQAEKPISSLRKNVHHVYGPLNGREWLAFTIHHYEYHDKQLDKILATPKAKQLIASYGSSRRTGTGG